MNGYDGRHDEPWTLNEQRTIMTKYQARQVRRARLHKVFSYFKSVMRFAGYVLLFFGVAPAVAVLLILSEALGVAEEVWGA